MYGKTTQKDMNIRLVPGLLMMSALLASAVGAAGKTDAPAEGRMLEKATFAGGCFWCMEHPFDSLDGVVSVTSGYTGGTKKNPTYQEVSAGGTGHAESVQIVYDPARIGYRKLLEVFWHNIDPTTPNRQFCDAGNQYRSAVFYHDGEQKKLAEESKRELERTKTFQGSVATEISPASEFYPAEEYHQQYYKKNPVRYKFYRYNCGRDQRLKELWGTKAGT